MKFVRPQNHTPGFLVPCHDVSCPLFGSQVHPSEGVNFLADAEASFA